MRATAVLLLLAAGCGTATQAVDAGGPDSTSADPTLDGGGQTLVTAPFGGGDWAQYRHDPSSTWENPGTFTAADVAKLQPAWTYELGPYDVSEPVLASGVVYVTAAFSSTVAALDASTGALKWSAQFDHVFTDPCSSTPDHTGIWASVGIADGVAYVPSPDGNLYALDASTGATLWSVGIASAAQDEFVESSPAIVGDTLYLGVASVFGCDEVQGRVLAIDLGGHAVREGALTPPGVRGAAVWSSVSVDSAEGKLFVTTGNISDAGFSAEPMAQAVDAIDPTTLAVMDHWQDATSPNDSDFGASPTLFNAADGTPLAAAPNKDGWLFVWDRRNLAAGPVWKAQLALAGDPTAVTGGQGSLVGPTFTHGLLIAAGGATPDGNPGSVTAFDPGTGAVLWRHLPPGYVMAGMPAVGDVLVVAVDAVGNQASTLELLDVNTGSVLRSFEAASPTYGAPILAQGLLVWSTYDGKVSAFRAPGP